MVLQLVATDSVATTPKTMPFAQAYIKKYGITPAYTGYTTYDEVYYHRRRDPPRRRHRPGQDGRRRWKRPIGRARSAGCAFFGKDDPFTHALSYGKDDVSGLVVQWQNGKQVPVWPLNLKGVQHDDVPALRQDRPPPRSSLAGAGRRGR